MSENRLNSCVLAHVHEHLLDELDAVEVVKELFCRALNILVCLLASCIQYYSVNCNVIINNFAIATVYNIIHSNIII